MARNAKPKGLRSTVQNVVVAWLRNSPGYPGGPVDTGKTFTGVGQDGYGLTHNRFLQMCDEITSTINQKTKRGLYLPGSWRDAHDEDTVNDFISAVTIKLQAAPNV